MLNFAERYLPERLKFLSLRFLIENGNSLTGEGDGSDYEVTEITPAKRQRKKYFQKK